MTVLFWVRGGSDAYVALPSVAMCSALTRGLHIHILASCLAGPKHAVVVIRGCFAGVRFDEMWVGSQLTCH